MEEGWKRLRETPICVQVLQELHLNLERRGVAREKIHQIVRDYSIWPLVENTLPLMRASLADQARWQLSLWDLMILAAARVSGASELFTEDFSHGQDYGGIKAINPYV